MTRLPLQLLLTALSLATSVVANPNCLFSGHNCQVSIHNATERYPNYADLNTSQLIEEFGYPAEVHRIVTEDGYVLTAQRIPHSPSSPPPPPPPPPPTHRPPTPKVPVFLLHGIFASSAQWFWQPTSRALVFMLADAGYDVWLGNTRGTSYSSESAPNGPTTSRKFWDFSHHEMGKFDIPATIAYILKTSSQPSLYYVGHSLGTTQLFVAIALDASIQKYIRTFVALAPVAFAREVTNPLFRSTAPLYSNYLVEMTATLLTHGPVLPPVIQSHLVDVTDFCAYSAIECSACSLGLFVLFGIDPPQTNFTTLPGFLAHLPDSVSGKTYSHVSQDVQKGTFDQYDYGRLLNRRKYGSPTPPAYDFWTHYSLPTVFFHSDNDNLAVPADVQRTAALLGSALKENNRLENPCWNHLDFVIAKDADIHVYNRILTIFNNRLYE